MPSKERRLILITNDDGIRAPGLRALLAPLSRVGDLVVVAPAKEQSGVSHSIIYRRPVRCRRVKLPHALDAWAVDAYPVDCVKIAMDRLMSRKPDLVVSGMNKGANLGGHLFYSGTVAAALEASIAGVSAVAVSLGAPPSDPFWNPDPKKRDAKPFDFDRAAAQFVEALKKIDKARLGPVAVNVNIPPYGSKVRGIRWAPQCAGPMPDTYVVLNEKPGRLRCRMHSRADEFPPDAGSDRALLAKGWITLTPMHSDLTCRRTLAKVLRGR